MGNAQTCCLSDSGIHPRSRFDGGQTHAEEETLRLDAKPPPCDGTLIINVVSCADLPRLSASKSGGKAPDTYVRLHLGSANQITKQTAVIERSCSPSYDESFEFRLAGGSSHTTCTLFVAVMVKGRLGVRASNDMLGEIQLSLRDVFCGRWSDRVGGEWELRDDFTRGVNKQQRSNSSEEAGLGRIELQLRFRPDVPDGLGLKLMPRSKRTTAILPSYDGKSIHSSHPTIGNGEAPLAPPPSDGFVRVHIRSCVGLLPTAGDATDSYVSVSVGGGESQQTGVQYQTISPCFDQEFEFFLDSGALPGSCVLLLKVRDVIGNFLGELELQLCREFAQNNWERRIKREYTLTDRLNRAPPREKKKRHGEPCPFGSVALTLTFEPLLTDGLNHEMADPWQGLTPARWRSGYVRPDIGARQRTDAVLAGRLPPTHVH